MSSPSTALGSQRRRRAAALAAGLSAFLFVGVSSPTAYSVAHEGGSGAPGGPPSTESERTPADPTPLFVEDFENDPSSDARLITDYVGAGGTRYSSDPVWADTAKCNGLVVGAGVTTPGCAAGPALGALARALGIVGDGVDPGANHAISAYTNGGAPGADKVQLETVAPVPIDVANRFVTFSVDTVAMNCHAPDDPLLSFSLLDGDVETPVSDSPINPCLDPGLHDLVVDGYALRGGRVVSKGAVLFSGTEMGVRLRNLQGGGAGNDGAFDNVRVVDVTPKADLTLPESAVSGDVVDLVVDVTNTSEAGAKPEWSFGQALPPGLTVAPTAGATSTCAAAVVTAPAGADRFDVQADFAEGDLACRIVVPVLVGDAGTRVVAASRSTLSGLLPSADRVLVVDTEAASISTSLRADLEDVAPAGQAGVADVGDRLTWVQTVVNVGNAPVGDVTSTRAGMTCEATVLAVGAGTSCASRTYTIDQAAVDGGDISAVVRAEAVSRLGAPVSTTDARASLPVASESFVTIAGGPVLDDADGDGLAGVRDGIGASYTVTNSGAVTLRDVAVVLDGRRVGVVTCPTGDLPPGRSVTCSMDDLVVVEDDLLAGVFDFTAHATATNPSDETLESVPVADEIPVVAARAALALGSQTRIVDGAAGPDGIADVGDDVTVTYRVRNEGTVTMSGLEVSTEVSGGTRGDAVCPVDSLAPGEEADCVTAPRSTSQPDVDAGGITFAATASAAAATGSVSAGPVVDVVPVTDPAGAVGLVSEVTVSDSDGVDRTGGEARPGDVVDARYTLTNEGTVTLTDVSLDVVDGLPQVRTDGVDGRPVGPVEITCDDDRLAPGESFQCTIAPRTVTEYDLGSPSLWLSATAAGLRPDGTLVRGLRASDPIGLIRPAPALTATTVVTKGGVRVGDLSVGDAWQGRVRVVNTGNVELSGLRASGVRCDVERLVIGQATDCTSSASTVTSRDAQAGGVSVTTVVHGVDRWGTLVEARSSARAAVGAEPVGDAPAGPLTEVLAFTGSPLAVTMLGSGLLLAAAGLGLAVGGRTRRSRPARSSTPADTLRD
jgi:hypothetical protein